MSGRTAIYRSEAGRSQLLAFYDAVLAEWPVPFVTHTVETRHGSTFVIDCGRADGPVLVLIHGAASNALSWMGDVPFYAPHLRVLAVDVPGEAGRSAENRPDHQGPAFGEWLADVVNQVAGNGAEGERAGKVSLLGISKGGQIALKFATAKPERVDKLVLLAPGGIAPARLSFLLRAIPLSMMGAAGRNRINSITFGGDAIHPAADEFMQVIMNNFRPEVPKPYIFTDEELRRLTMPTLLLMGLRDGLLQAEKTLARAERLIPGATCVPLAGRGHVLMGLADRILPFLVPAGRA